MMDQALLKTFKARYYCTYPASDYPGTMEEKIHIDPKESAMIVLHARNIDTKGGIPSPEAFPVFMEARN